MVDKYLSDPELSIIVPVYNSDKYIRECIESIINQTYNSYELILVDDGSEDNSGKICDEYALKYVNINVLHTGNGGSVRARKRGLSLAKGRYIGFVDADDYIHENMYEHLMALIKKVDGDFIVENYYEMRDESLKLVDLVDDEEICINTLDERRKVFSKYYLSNDWHIPYGLQFKVYKRLFIMNCFDRIPEDQQYGEDSLVLMWMLILANRFVLSERAYYYYRIQDQSLSHFSSRFLFEKEYNLSKCRQMIFNENRDVIDEEKYWDFTYMKLAYSYELKTTEESNSVLFRWWFYDIDKLRDKKILIYGAGDVGTDYYYQLSIFGITIAAISDKRASFINFPFRCDIIEPYSIRDYIYDYLLIAVKSERIAEKIKMELSLYGISEEKILWKRPIRMRIS